MTQTAKPSRRWALLIDNNVCTGCSACVVACRAENNLPITGPAEAAANGSFQWLRIERRWKPAGDTWRVEQTPVMCQQCADAPCEPVCPVFATYHTDEGLNAQVYNRCIGTRYCANNCPYVARFFNWFDPAWPSPMQVQLNPEVSQRTRGIMEKCTFCVQRIQAGERQARLEGRALRDGEVQPACVQSCPAEAMLFGDLDDPHSRIARAVAGGAATTLLGELGTRPAVQYLPRPLAPVAEEVLA